MTEPTPANPITLRPMTESDWPTVQTIYAEGIATGHATFETATPEWEAGTPTI